MSQTKNEKLESVQTFATQSDTILCTTETEENPLKWDAKNTQHTKETEPKEHSIEIKENILVGSQGTHN